PDGRISRISPGAADSGFGSVPLRGRLAAWREDDVAFRMAGRGAVGDLADRARAGTANGDGLGASLGRHEKVARTHSRPDEIYAGDAQDGVGAGMRVAGGATVGEVGGLA